MTPESFTITRRGDEALWVDTGSGPDAESAARVRGLVRALDHGRPAFVADVVPGWTGALVIWDLRRAGEDEVRAHVSATAARARPIEGQGRRVEIPVLYSPEVAPDLDELAASKHLAPAELARRHAAPEYRVALIGFRPGFGFLAGLDPDLAAPRLATPRARVAAGSVGIGGPQTGVYPQAGPGGWRIIGRTPVVLWDAARREPALLAWDDRVRFVPIDRRRFEELGG